MKKHTLRSTAGIGLALALFAAPFATLSAQEAASTNAAAQTPAAPAAPAELIRNGDMTRATAKGLPSGWSLASHKKGEISLSRDTNDFISAPASLLMTLTPAAGESEAEGFVQQPLHTLPASGSLSVRGMVRAEGTFNMAQIVFQVFDANWKQLDWNIVDFVKPTDDWVGFGTSVKLPAGARHVIFGVIAKGQGSVWLDDVRITESPAAN